MKKNFYSTSDKIILISALLCFMMLSSLFMSTFINKYKKSKLIEQGIYEIDNTYNTENNRILVYYMICEPPSEYEELKLAVQDFIIKNDIVQMLINRDARNDYNYICINFIGPSEHFPAGWNGGMGYDFLTCNISNHELIYIFIPYDENVNIEDWRYSSRLTCKG